MGELEILINELTGYTAIITEALLNVMSEVLNQISLELKTYVWEITFGIEDIVLSMVELIYDTSYVDFWDMQGIVWDFYEYVEYVAGDVASIIDSIYRDFRSLIPEFMSIVEKSLAEIEVVISEHYRERNFRIYGRIAEVSVAIGAPPAYLESAIETAKSFLLAVSSRLDLSYDRFELAWENGLSRMLRNITAHIAFYKQNPQWIKIDLTNELIREAYELNRQRSQTNDNHRKKVDESLVSITQQNEELMFDIYDLTDQLETLWQVEIKPALKQVTDNFENWEKNTYAKRNAAVRNTFLMLADFIRRQNDTLDYVQSRISHIGNLAKQVDLLEPSEILIQENKLSEVATRATRRLTNLWVNRVQTLVKKD